MFNRHLSLTLLLLMLSGGISAEDANALRGRDGTVYFAEVPRLVNASVTRKRSNAPGATLKFTVTLPTGAGEPLSQIFLTQDQNIEALRISPERVSVALGDTWTLDTPKIATEVLVPPSNQREPIQISFDPPLPPGNTITIGLRPPRTPRSSGVYQFGVTALPVGEQPHEYFLGYGRITLFDIDNDDFPLFR